MAMAFVTDLTTEAQYKSEITDTPGTLQVIEVYQPWCGPSKAVQSTFKRLYFDLNDRPLKFYSAAADRLPFLKEYLGKCIPVFLFFKDGKQLEKVQGVQAPALNRLVLEHSAVKAAAGA
ncbi:Dynein light chain, flagellar outer arm [Tetrabaena socialis]|uniref:Dynein light chain, flagellar outer arm n=1 Tax=Tetrabaena socialis TaxID=47790 RepID=A0A2J7ZZ51_9CHLO|nr:Dynein light chain, flagellar outer arm [Tetrabaena socialis]|eukprot:PNH05551.1 Dynein light chain, flagellar outer arm [Tetrabaena socialis]